MSTDDGIYREVDQDLAEDKQLRDLKNSLPWMIGLAVLVIAIVAGKQIWDAQKQAAAEANATAFSQALAVEDADAARAAFADIRETSTPGYAALAAFRLAGLEAREGNREEAIAALSAVAADEDLTTRLRDLARVRAAYLALEESGDAALRQLNGMQETDTVMAAYAKEIAGLAALEREDYTAALRYFEGIETITGAPQPVIARAEEFASLARLGESGISLDYRSVGQSLESLLDLPVQEAPHDEAGHEEPAPAESVENESQQGGTSAD